MFFFWKAACWAVGFSGKYICFVASKVQFGDVAIVRKKTFAKRISNREFDMLADPPSQSRKEVATSAHLSTGKSHHIPEIFHSLPLAWVCMKSKVEPTIISSGMTFFGNQNEWSTIRFSGHSGDQNNSDALDQGFKICWSALFGHQNGWNTIHFSGNSGGQNNSDALDQGFKIFLVSLIWPPEGMKQNTFCR